MSRPDISQLEKGQILQTRRISFSRADLIRYAAASGDHNPIHWNERFAREVGLDGVIAHGMLTMGAAVGLVTDWAGDPSAVVDYQTRFTAPVPVPDPGSGSPEAATAELEVTAKIGKVDLEASTARIDLTVELLGAEEAHGAPDEGDQEDQRQRTRVLTKAQAVVAL